MLNNGLPAQNLITLHNGQCQTSQSNHTHTLLSYLETCPYTSISAKPRNVNWIQLRSCVNRFIPPTKSKLLSKDVLQISLTLKRNPRTMKLPLGQHRLWSTYKHFWCWQRDRVGKGVLVGPENNKHRHFLVTQNNFIPPPPPPPNTQAMILRRNFLKHNCNLSISVNAVNHIKILK
jgi:hypothetical protein